MVNALLFIYLAAPVLVAAAAILYALTRAPDRIQLATVALFAASLIHVAQAYELTKLGGSEVIGIALGIYALAVYVCMGALAVYLKRWAWRAAFGAFVLHILVGLFAAPSAQEQGAKGIVVLLAYLSLGVVGVWALLHRGSRRAVAMAPQSEA